MMIAVLEHTFYKKDKEGHTEVESGRDCMFTLSP